MSPPPPQVAWGAGTAGALLTDLLGEPVVVRHLCPACGSISHGRPWTRLVDGRRPDISVAHTGALTVVGATWTGRLGVDVEPAGRVPPSGDLDLWVRAEAYLKSVGEGLRRDPATVGLSQPGATWGQLDVGPGFVAAWCLVSRGDLAGPSGPTRH